jgi:cytochrome b pre-mRNA-processing protein 3
MGLFSWIVPGGAAAARQAEALYGTIVAVGRRPQLYGVSRIPDTFDGRFEAACLTASLALIRLRELADARQTAAIFTDRLFRGFDAGFREAGVGDLSVPRKMTKVAQNFYGRLDAYAGALQPGADPDALRTALERNIWPDGAEKAFAAPLAASVRLTAEALATVTTAALTDPNSWPLGVDL